MTSNKNLNTIINMNGNADEKVTFLQKRKTLYENKIFGFSKDVIKSRESLRTAEQNYNQKQTKANKNKFDDKKLDYEENVENLTEYKNNYTGIMYQYFNELFDKWDVNRILSFIKKNSFDKIKNEIHKTREQLFKLSNKASVTHNKIELNKIAEESKPLHENMDDWIKLRQFYSILFLEFENEFYEERNKELEQYQKITTEKRKQALVKARQAKREKSELRKLKKYNTSVLLFRKLNEGELVDFYILKTVDKEKFKKKYHGYVLGKKGDIHMKYNKVDKVITVKADNNFEKGFQNQRIYNDDVDKFKYAIRVLKTNKDMKTFIEMVCESNSISLIIFGHISEDKNQNGTNPEEISYHDSLSNEKLFLKYIDYDVNHDSETFKDLFITKDNFNDYKENSCFLNLIVSTYRDKFPSGRYNPLTFDSLCSILQIENIEQNIGLTVKQSVSFFQNID